MDGLGAHEKEMEFRRYLRGLDDNRLWALYKPSGVGRGNELVAQEVYLRCKLEAAGRRARYGA